jgi:PAS domain S-box-containing protein
LVLAVDGIRPLKKDCVNIKRFGGERMILSQNSFGDRVQRTLPDVTDRQASKESLIEYGPHYMEQYRFVVENLKEVVFRTDAEGHWTFLNSAWAEVTGFTVEESLGKVFLEYVYPEDRELNLALFRPLIERKKDYCRHEIRYTYKDRGFRYIEVWARLTLDEKGNSTGTAGTLTDITERKQAEKEREELILKLENALSEVKKLSGLIPICASCKNIRNDKGYWEKVEVYIRDRSEADFSHDICPDCAQKLYPEYFKKK